MQFVLYSEKTVSQCLSAIHDRMQVKGTATRPALDGWVEKSGTFSLTLSAPVIGRFTRSTAIKAHVEREGTVTVIRGSVSSGVARQGLLIIYAALAVVILTMLSSGSVLLGLVLIPFGAYLYIPLHGDYLNSTVLLDEIEKTLKAKDRPPKKAATSEIKSAAKRPAVARQPTATKSVAAKPAAKPKPSPVTAAPKPKPSSATTAAPKPAPRPAATDLADASEFPPMEEP